MNRLVKAWLLPGLLISLFLGGGSHPAAAQSVPYGNNPQAGHYVSVGNTKIYYESYGQGPLVVLLHGGLFGYIDEFTFLIESLRQSHRVLAIATRGHGKSEVGNQPFSYRLFAQDAYAIIRSVTHNKVNLIGFSDGAITAYLLAAAHPELVQKVVAIGGGLLGYQQYTPEESQFWLRITDSQLNQIAPGFVGNRQKLMPQPADWKRFIEQLKQAWQEPIYVKDPQLRMIQCPTLIVAGDQDGSVERYVKLYRLFPHAQLAVIPGSGHLVLSSRPDLIQSLVHVFFAP